MKRTTALTMALWIALAALLGIGASAPEPKDCVPIVFVHGLGGWGEGALFDLVMPHWGMLAGSMRKNLNRRGYEAYAASVGPVSSAWDRACELYAHLTGTRVDYGQNHSETHGHARYGERYKKPLVKDWSADKPIALLGHSFGGPTINLFAHLCEQGSAAEMAAGQKELSPLFTGELKGRIFAVLTLSGVLNGSTAMEAYIAEAGGISGSLAETMLSMARMGMILPIAEKFYPFRLGHFGLNAKHFYRNPIGAWKAGDAFLAQKDCSAFDLTIDGAAKLNKFIDCQPGIYYFSFAAQATEADAEGNQVPKDFVWSMFRETSAAIGKKHPSFTTPAGVLIDDSWLPNDGLVNVVSAQYPFGEPHKPYDASKLEKGVWQVMPTVTGFDHVDFAGGMQKPGGVEGFEAFYLDIIGILEKLL